MAGHVFISYARANQLYVETLAKFLKDHSIPVWYDYQLETGDIFWQKIQTVIDDSAAVLVVLTPEASESQGVWREVSYAAAISKPIFPLNLKPTEAMIVLADLQREDVTGDRMPSDALYRKLRGLAAADAIRRRTLEYPQVGERVGDLVSRVRGHLTVEQ